MGFLQRLFLSLCFKRVSDLWKFVILCQTKFCFKSFNKLHTLSSLHQLFLFPLQNSGVCKWRGQKSGWDAILKCFNIWWFYISLYFGFCSYLYLLLWINCDTDTYLLLERFHKNKNKYFFSLCHIDITQAGPI